MDTAPGASPRRYSARLRWRCSTRIRHPGTTEESQDAIEPPNGGGAGKKGGSIRERNASLKSDDTLCL